MAGASPKWGMTERVRTVPCAARKRLRSADDLEVFSIGIAVVNPVPSSRHGMTAYSGGLPGARGHSATILRSEARGDLNLAPSCRIRCTAPPRHIYSRSELSVLTLVD